MASPTNKTRSAPPRASALVEALRGLGYSTATAIADLVDNSIAARATRVDITFQWDGDRSHIKILDDGIGMDDAGLFRAMRLGEINPLAARAADDLGRFGLGLKTASFSQCRRLTVASKKSSVVSCLQWDLDVLANSVGDHWPMLEGVAQGSEHLLDPLQGRASGTLVLWEALDRIVGPGFSVQDLLDLVDTVERHLSMVFHRYLEKPNPRLVVTINGKPLVGWDPFLSNHPATWESPAERLVDGEGAVILRGYVLPHKDRLDLATHASAGGPDGWTAQQGFYVYRNERLLVSGSWLGLGQGRSWTKEEAHRLARIRLDLPNTADTQWKIDVRKSRAQPPVVLSARAEINRDIRS